ncbi:ribosomal protein L10 family protein [Heterostelium album PN500]|uniref:Ribosome assembly factor mrt4 n=1 Tax=Heterostelium pallidum (strain ATCC 26659 / Pp 5 / PN500) TaxID=670386 RepID=D3B7B3_HETP5|nr:ribosomal protein L10 family protein [Heterostelium album PN500]EFA82656.1 ribosomal protein L10 family protein [Heterostelium album PN500]|eukprot:XP_020434773.1 ribosomal protein L10 family protein [Heterostelium album PN500]
MVQSKRSKAVSLTKVTKNPNQKKSKLISTVRECVEEYSDIYLISFDNVRNNHLKQARADWSNSRFLFGKKKVLSIGLGRADSDEQKPGLSKLSQNLQSSGECCLFFTNDPKDTVLSEVDFARAGFEPEETITLKQGPIDMTHTQEPYLRRLGMPTSLKNGVIILERDYDLCEKGTVLTPDQARLLQLFDHKISEFKFILLGYWKDAEYYALQEPSADVKSEDMNEDDSEDDE